VGITEEALFQAQRGRKPLYNFNIYEEDFDGMCNIVGPAEVTLPLLQQFMMLQVNCLMQRPQLWYGNSIRKLASEGAKGLYWSEGDEREETIREVVYSQ